MNIIQRAAFYKQLATLIKAGIPLNRALDILATQAEKKFNQKISFISLLLEKGKSFTESMYDLGFIGKDVKSSFKIAEENACLINILERTAFLYEKKDRHEKELIRTLMYPAIVFFSSMISLVFLLLFVLPSYVRYFSDSGLNLPLVTRVAISLPSFGPIVSLIILIASMYFVGCIKNQDLRLKIPLAGGVFKDSFLRDFCYLLNYQLKSGVPFVSALKNIADDIDGKQLKKDIAKIINEIENGKSISLAFSGNKIFDGMFSQIVSIGEESGSLSDMIFETGEHYTNTYESQLKKYASLVEPFATIFVGGIVCFMALAMLMPLFSVVNSLL